MGFTFKYGFLWDLPLNMDFLWELPLNMDFYGIYIKNRFFKIEFTFNYGM